VLAVLEDGAGGHGFGEVASQLSVDTVARLFGEIPADASPNQLLWRMFNAANLAVYDQGMAQQGSGERRMATTLTALLFRYNEVFVGHVGDCRAYLIHQGQIERLTTDHSYVGMQVKMGLLSEHDAATSDMRTMLTRLIGQNPTIQVDFNKALVTPSEGLKQLSEEGSLFAYNYINVPKDGGMNVGVLAIPRGAVVHGVVTEVKKVGSGDLGGSSVLALTLT